MMYFNKGGVMETKRVKDVRVKKTNCEEKQYYIRIRKKQDERYEVISFFENVAK